MKIMGKRIPKGSVLLFLSFMALSVCLMLITYTFRTSKELNLGQNNLYSGHQKNFSISQGENETEWDEVLPKLLSEGENYAIYVPLQADVVAMRGPKA